MNAPIMLAPIFRADSTITPPSLTEVVAAIRTAAASTARVMPPIAAKWMTHQLKTVANAVASEDFMWRMLLDRWMEAVDEINAYAARARSITEHEVFLAGISPEDARYTEPAETLDDALAADRWLSGAGAAHRPVIHLYGPWVIDRPAANTIKEPAA